MNVKNLNLLLDKYIEKFDTINNDVHSEYYKWIAVKHFRDNWKIDEPDFASMFKRAVKETSVLIDNKIMHPTSGIIKLSERPELTENVRGMFRELYADDGGDISERQKRIERFIGEADRLLKEYEPGKFSYTQDMRTVISYLAMMYPEQNYLYKATQAREFMYCVEYGDDFGCGSEFKLGKYYTMCDALVEEIKKRDDLIAKHKSRLNETMCSEDDYHILAYDIIYCAIVYDFYQDINYVKPIKSTGSSAEKQRLLKVDEWNRELENVKRELSDKLRERAEYDYFSAKGLDVYHQKFGQGTVVEHYENVVRICFSVGEKKFQLPQGFTNGFLKIDSTEIMELFATMAEIDNEIGQLRSRIENLRCLLTINQ